MNNDVFKRIEDRLPQIEVSHVDTSPASFFPKEPGSQLRVCCIETPMCEPSVKNRTLVTLQMRRCQSGTLGIDELETRGC